MRPFSVGYLSLRPLWNCNSDKEKSWLEKDGEWMLTYIKVKGEWRYLYRAVDKVGNTVDFLLTKRRQRISASKFLIKAITDNSKP
jgi:putative transposase